MAEYILSAEDAAEAAREVEQTQRSLRILKNRLQAKFPDVKSSHLTEAIAAGLGYQTNAALRVDLDGQGPKPWQLRYVALEAAPFRDRLLALKYPLQPDLRMGNLPAPPSPSSEYKGWLRQLGELERAPKNNWDAIYALRARCAQEFARVFDLGHRENRDDKRVARWLTAGIDHGACLPGWGGRFNSRHALVNFPGTDHAVNFCQSLPLASGKVVEYQSAIVSMPYKDGSGSAPDLAEAAFVAGRIGWTCTALPEWSWYAPGETTLVLFKRTTPHAEMLRAWENSFKRWVLENRTRLNKSAGDTKRKVLDDIAHCQHMPFDLVDFDDCRERYLKEFVSRLYDDGTDVMGRAFKRLMEAWQQATLAPGVVAL